MVFIAVFKERKLQNTTNFFLISLSIADCMVALFVMPTGLIVEILGHFPFPPVYCVIWIGMDVLCCTCSIHHMTMMALDRYLTIKFPLKYGRNKSKRMTLIKIILVWLISISICSPLIILGFINERNVYEPDQKICLLFNKAFRLYGSLFAFYVPFIIMLIAYSSTIKILRQILGKKIDQRRIEADETLIIQKKSFMTILEKLLSETHFENRNSFKNFNKAKNSPTKSLDLTETKKPGNFFLEPPSSNPTRFSFINYQNARKVANNEHKALRVLIIIFSVFVALWSPFFILNIFTVICEEFVKMVLKTYEPLVYSFLTWLGYLSSAANPLVYTMFNKSFRIAFIKILTCKKATEKRFYFQRRTSSQNNINITVNNFSVTNNNSNVILNNFYLKHDTRNRLHSCPNVLGRKFSNSQHLII